MIYPTIARHNQYDTARLNQMSIQCGIVVAHQPGTNMIQVRLPGAGERIVSRVVIPYGATFQAEDRVLIVKAPTDTHWMAVCRLQEADQYGLYASSAMQENELHRPSDFVVFAADQLLVAHWNAWPGKALCYQVQYDTYESDTLHYTIYTYGSFFLYKPDPPGAYYVRCRALSYDVVEDAAYYGAWTLWASATTVQAVTIEEFDSLHSLFVTHVLEQEWAWALHLTGAT